MNRISTANAYDTSVDNLQRRQQDLYQAQDRMTSGKRVARASDDPTAAHRGVDGVGPVRGIDHDDLRVVTDQPRVVLVDRRPRRVRVAGGQHLLDSRAHAVETSGLSRQAAVVVPGSRVPGPPSISLSPWNDGRTSSRGCSAPSRWR